MFDGSGKLDSIKMSIYGDRQKVTVELYDHLSGQTFLRMNCSPAAFVEMFSSRRCHVTVNAEFFHMERVGKLMEMQELKFELPPGTDYSNREKIALEEAKKHVPEGWTSDGYYGSQNSFRYDGNTYHARTIIRRWVDAVDGTSGRESGETRTVVSG